MLRSVQLQHTHTHTKESLFNLRASLGRCREAIAQKHDIFIRNSTLSNATTLKWSKTKEFRVNSFHGGAWAVGGITFPDIIWKWKRIENDNSCNIAPLCHQCPATLCLQGTFGAFLHLVSPPPTNSLWNPTSAAHQQHSHSTSRPAESTWKQFSFNQVHYKRPSDANLSSVFFPPLSLLIYWFFMSGTNSRLLTWSEFSWNWLLFQDRHKYGSVYKWRVHKWTHCRSLWKIILQNPAVNQCFFLIFAEKLASIQTSRTGTV